MGDGTAFQIKAVGSLKLSFHLGSSLLFPAASTDLRNQLTDVYVVEGVKLNFFSVHHVQQTRYNPKFNWGAFM